MSNTRLTRLSACGLLLASFYMRPAGQWQRRLALYPYIARVPGSNLRATVLS